MNVRLFMTYFAQGATQCKTADLSLRETERGGRIVLYGVFNVDSCVIE